MRIVLIGPRGSGKTTVAEFLAERLDWPIESTDAFVEKKLNKPIAGIVQDAGWKAFRQAETEAVSFLCQLDQTVIDTGGGVVENEDNVAMLKREAYVVYLTGDPETLASRIDGDVNRPPLTDAGDPIEEIRRILKQRDTLYRGAADLVLDTTSENPQSLAEKIERCFRTGAVK